ncbi:MAG: efflux RND transporter permease subunit, partial [Actinomycetota bacterium]
DLKGIGEDVVARRLEQLDGIARVRVTGGYEREVRINVRPDRMAAYGIDLPRIEQALQDANVSLAGGTIQKGPFRYAVEVSGEFRNAGEIAAAVVSERGRPTVRLNEISKVEDAVARRRGMVRFDGREVLLLLVERSPDANTVQVAAEARQVLTDLRQELSGISLDVVVDESTFIEAAIGGVFQALIWGGLLAIVVLLVFLRRPRMLAAVAIAAPLSLALALVLFDLLGVTLNLISLSGLALGVGLLVDNSIVVVENITRLRETGLPPHEAAAEGASEVAGAITASTLTTLAVFVPLIFVEGLAGRLFRDQSLAVACSVGASLLVALTVVPLVAARDRGSSRFGASRPSPGLATYERWLDRCLARPRRVLVGALAFLFVTAAIALHLPREVVPKTDERRLDAELTVPTDADLSLVASRASEIEASLTSLRGVAHVLADLGERDDARQDLQPRPPYAGNLTIVLGPEGNPAAILRELGRMPLPPDLSLEVRPVRTQLESLLVPGDSELVIDLTSDDRAAAEIAAPRLLAALVSRPELANVVRADPDGVPAYDLRFDRDALARLGASADTLDGHLEAAARGRAVTRLHLMREDIPIVLRAESGSVDGLLAQRVPAGAGLLPLSAFVHAEPVSLPAMLTRHGQTPVVRLLADLAPGVGLAEGVAAIESIFASTLPTEVRARIGGANEAFRQSLTAMGWSLLSSVLLVYLILAAQFESLTQPLVVLSVVPLAIGGVTLALAVTGHSWNLMSLTGCVVLVGIAVNDAIVKVDFIRRRRREGLPIVQAVRQAGHDRFRPIVMTTVTTALGLLPLALGLGTGGSLRAPLAVAIVGGVWVATALTLATVPAFCVSLGAEAATREQYQGTGQTDMGALRCEF